MMFLPMILCGVLGCDNQKQIITASGTLEATQTLVASRLNATVKRIMVGKGSLVKKDELLVELDNQLLGFKLKQAEQSLALAETEVSLLSKGARGEDISQAAAMVVQAENSFKIAEDDFKRMQALYQSGSITTKQYSDAEKAYQIAKAQLEAAQQNYSKIKNLVRPEELKAVLIKRDLAQTALAAAQEEFSYLNVKAPKTGTVVDCLVEEGELVFPGSPLILMADLSKLELTIYVSAKELPFISIGQEARIKIDSLPDKSFGGQITYISPEAEFTPKNVQTKEDRVKLVFAVKIAVDNPLQILKPGLYADAEILKSKAN